MPTRVSTVSSVVGVITGQQLFELVRARLQATGDTEIARLLGFESYASPQRVKRWRTGLNEPDYEGTIALLDAVGFLTDEGRDYLGLPARPLSVAETAELADATSEGERAEQRLERPAPGSRRRRTG